MSKPHTEVNAVIEELQETGDLHEFLAQLPVIEANFREACAFFSVPFIPIYYGESPHDGTGDSVQIGIKKINTNFLLIASGMNRLSIERQKLRDLVNTQAEDEGLWFVAKYITEAYLQQALRELHALIEENGDI